MRHTLLFACLAILSGVLAAQVPSVPAGGILNSASYTLDGLPNAGVAQGSLIVIYGDGLGPASGQQIASPFPLSPSGLAGTQVKVTSGGITVDAPVVYASANLVKAILPSNTPAGNANLFVIYNGMTSAPTPVKVIRSGFGMYTLNQAGSGPAVLTDTTYSVNTLTNAHEPNSILTLWGTGLGPGTGDELKGTVQLDAAAASQVEVWVGGMKAQILYAGRGGGYAGLDQINFVIPAGLGGCRVPVFVKVGDIGSNFGSIAVAAPGKKMCADAFSYSEEDLRTAQTTGLKTASIVLARQSMSAEVPVLGKISINNDSALGTFGGFTLTSLIQSQAIGGISTLGSCVVHTFKGTEPAVTDPVQAAPLDAGASLQLTGPNGAKTIDRAGPGSYVATFSSQPGDPGYLIPGQYTVKGSGGADVGSFTATLTVPAPLVWTNQDSISDISRSQDLSVTWTGGAAGDAVAILGASLTQKADAGALFLCAERADKGAFTVPAAVLQSLPASTADPTGFTASLLSVGNLPPFDQHRFNATGIDQGFFYYTTLTAKQVAYK